MPYKSKAQIRYMHSQHPEIAKRWDEKYDAPSNLPNKVHGGNITERLKKYDRQEKKKK